MRSTKWMAEDVLLLLAFGLEQMTSRSLTGLTESYEGWEYRNRLRHHYRHLESQQLLTRERRAEGVVYRLTDAGQLAVAGGRHPERCWNRFWDGRWRMVLFDLPAQQHKVRQRLWRWLRGNHFGYLQNSVWIHPDPVPEVVAALGSFRDNVESFTVMEANCVAGTPDTSVVNGAWDFAEINQRYQAYLSAVNQPQGRTGATRHAWLHQERLAWWHAVSLDPLLPRPLWPKGYLGGKAWQARRQFFSLPAESGATEL